MEVRLKKGMLTIKRKLKKSETYKISKGGTFDTISIFKKPRILKGFSNCCEDSQFIITLDYDEIYKHIVLEDVKILQQKYDLVPFYLFTTLEEKDEGGKRGNYHLINLQRFTYREVSEIIAESRCDPKYKSMNNRNPYKSWVLRIGGKGKRGRPKFLGVVGENINLDKEISQAHLILFQKLYPKIKHPPYKNLDDGKRIFLQKYETS